MGKLYPEDASSPIEKTFNYISLLQTAVKGLGVGPRGKHVPFGQSDLGVLQLLSFGIMMAHAPSSSGLLLSLLTDKTTSVKGKLEELGN